MEENAGRGLKKNRSIGGYLLFLVWPFCGMFATFKWYRKDWAKNVFWLFCIYYGLTFIIAADNPGAADSARYARWLSDMYSLKFSFKQFIDTLYSTETNYTDIAQPLITFLVSRFTDNSRVLFVIFAVIFGYFYSRNIWFVLDRIEGKITVFITIFILTFLLLNPVWNIGGFRMWTAANIFIYGSLQYLVSKKKSGLIWSISAIFFHFSFFLPIIALLIFSISGRKLSLSFWMFFFSFFISEFPMGKALDLMQFLPDVYQKKILGYSNPDYIQGITEATNQLNWYVIYSDKILNWTVLVIATAIYFLGRKALSERRDFASVFSFAMFIYFFANIANSLPSGHRFITISNIFMFIFFIWFISIMPNRKLFKPLLIISMPSLFLYDIFLIRIGLDFTSLFTIIGNPILAIFVNDSTSLISLIK